MIIVDLLFLDWENVFFQGLIFFFWFVRDVQLRLADSRDGWMGMLPLCLSLL